MASKNVVIIIAAKSNALEVNLRYFDELKNKIFIGQSAWPQEQDVNDLLGQRLFSVIEACSDNIDLFAVP